MKYIDAEKLKAEIEQRMNKHWEGLPDADSQEDDWTYNELCELGAYKELEHIEDFLNSLQQEQPEVEFEKEINKFFENVGMPVYWCNDAEQREFCSNLARHFYGLRNRALEEAARHVYESWMGGTMDDVRRDMVELGRVINERKED